MAKQLKPQSADGPRRRNAGRVREYSRLSDLKGLGKELWQGIDAQKYVDALREDRDLPASDPQ